MIGNVFYLSLRQLRCQPCRARAPFVRYADISPADGGIHPLHKGAFIALTEQLYKLKFEALPANIPPVRKTHRGNYAL